MKLRVAWFPQIPCDAFYVPVDSVAEAVKLMRVLADYDKFQLDNRIKPDYCNAGTLQMFDPSDDTDSPEGSWVDWCDEQTGEDDPQKWLDDDDAGKVIVPELSEQDLAELAEEFAKPRFYEVVREPDGSVTRSPVLPVERTGNISR